jgi:hypothetical protein
MSHKILLVLRASFILILILLGSMLADTFLHEAGHALTALALGGDVTDFNINFLDMSAHVSLSGSFTRAQHAWINLNGSALPFVLWLFGMLALPKHTNPLGQVIKGITALIVVNTLLAWMALPILHLFHCAPPGDDVTQFLFNSEWHPLNVALTAAGLYFLGWVVTIKRIEQPGAALSALLKMDVPHIPGTLVSALVTISALLIVISSISFATCRDQSRIPNGYTLIKDIDLSAENFAQEPLLSFTLAAPERTSFLLHVQNLDTRLVDVTLQKVDGDPITLLHGEGFSTPDNISNINLMLGAGDYQIVLTTQNAIGRLRLYLKHP